MIKIPVNSDIMNFLNEKYGEWFFKIIRKGRRSRK